MRLMKILWPVAILVLSMNLVSCGTDTKKSEKNEVKKESRSLAIIYCDQIQAPSKEVNQSKQGCVVRPDEIAVVKSPTYVPNPTQAPGQAPSQSPNQGCQRNCSTSQYPAPDYNPYKDGGCSDQYCGFTKDAPYQNGPWQGNQYQDSNHYQPYSQCYQTYGGGCNDRNFFYGFMLRIGFRIDFSFFSHQQY